MILLFLYHATPIVNEHLKYTNWPSCMVSPWSVVVFIHTSPYADVINKSLFTQKVVSDYKYSSIVCVYSSLLNEFFISPATFTLIIGLIKSSWYDHSSLSHSSAIYTENEHKFRSNSSLESISCSDVLQLLWHLQEGNSKIWAPKNNICIILSISHHQS